MHTLHVDTWNLPAVFLPCVEKLSNPLHRFRCLKTKDIGGPHIGDDDNDVYVLDLADFGSLDESFAAEIVSRIATPCATNVEIVGLVTDAAGTPKSIACEGSGETCGVHGETRSSSALVCEDVFHD